MPHDFIYNNQNQGLILQINRFLYYNWNDGCFGCNDNNKER